MPAPRRSRRRQQGQEEPQWGDKRWPLLTATWEGLEPAEIAERHARAALLLEEGYGAIEAWLLEDEDPSPQQQQESASSTRQGQLGIFDVA